MYEYPQREDRAHLVALMAKVKISEWSEINVIVIIDTEGREWETVCVFILRHICIYNKVWAQW